MICPRLAPGAARLLPQHSGRAPGEGAKPPASAAGIRTGFPGLGALSKRCAYNTNQRILDLKENLFLFLTKSCPNVFNCLSDIGSKCPKPARGH